MINKWVKSSAIVLTAAALFLGGCSQAAKTNNTSTQTAAPNKVETSKAKPVTIKVHTWYNLENEKLDLVAQEFEKQHPDIKVEFVSAGDNNNLESLKK